MTNFKHRRRGRRRTTSTAGTPSHHVDGGDAVAPSRRRGRRRISWFVVAALLLVAMAFASGCRSEECARMMACCQQVKDVKGVGEACGPRTNSVDDPKTCKTIVETIGYMFEEKGKELPEVCKLED